MNNSNEVTDTNVSETPVAVAEVAAAAQENVAAAAELASAAESTTEAVQTAVKTRKTRTVDYGRTDKKPHSFRYKRGSAFAPRGEAVSLSKESDGALVIGPLPTGVEAEPEAAKFETGVLKLVSVKKRPNGKTAITFESDIGTVVVYDARAARAALRSI